MKTLVTTLLMFTVYFNTQAQNDSIIKSAHYKVVLSDKEEITYEYTEYYNKKGQLDSIYRRPSWADSTYAEILSEMYSYLPNGKIDYILNYDSDDIIGQLLTIDNYIYENSDIQSNRFIDCSCFVENTYVFGNGNIVEFKMYEKNNCLSYINFWEIHFYDSLSQVTKIIDLIEDNYTTNKYNSKGILEKQTYLTTFNRTYFFEDEQSNESQIYEFDYEFNQNNHWIKKEKIDVYDEKSIIETIHRTIKYY